MATILLDIRDYLLGALIIDGDSIVYDWSCDLHSSESPESAGEEPAPLEELFFRPTGEKETILTSTLSGLIKDAAIAVSSGYLLVPDSYLISDSITLPKMQPEDTRKLIERKFNPTGTLQLHISLAEESQQNQTWSAEYIPVELIDKFRDSFRRAGLKLQGISTSSHVAMHAFPKEANLHLDKGQALYELSPNAIEGFYFNESMLIHHERSIIDESASIAGSGDEEQFRKRILFKILDGIYRINTLFVSSNPGVEVRQLLLCGTHPQIAEISESLIDAIGIEGLLLSDQDGISPVAGRYTMLTGYANALQQGLAVNFLHHDHLPQKALRIRTGLYIYSITAILVFASVAFRESNYSKLSAELLQERQILSRLKVSSSQAIKQAESLALLKKQLHGNPLFYDLFRDLANNLPDGIYLNGITIKQLEGRRTIEILTVTRLSPAIHQRKLLTHLNAYLSHSGFLRISKEPVISVTGRENDKSVQMKFVCELEAK